MYCECKWRYTLQWGTRVLSCILLFQSSQVHKAQFIPRSDDWAKSIGMYPFERPRRTEQGIQDRYGHHSNSMRKSLLSTNFCAIGRAIFGDRVICALSTIFSGTLFWKSLIELHKASRPPRMASCAENYRRFGYTTQRISPAKDRITSVIPRK